MKKVQAFKNLPTPAAQNLWLHDLKSFQVSGMKTALTKIKKWEKVQYKIDQVRVMSDKLLLKWFLNYYHPPQREKTNMLKRGKLCNYEIHRIYRHTNELNLSK